MTRLCLLIFLLSFLRISSQELLAKYIDQADEHFEHQNYQFAIPLYKAALQKDSLNNEVKYKLGICYVNTRINRAAAVRYLSEAARDSKTNDDVWLYLGQALHLEHRIGEAIEAFEKCRKVKLRKQAEAEKYLKWCRNAQELMTRPVPVRFQNLGSGINGPEPDYNPFIDKEEMSLVFTSRRLENLGGKKVEVDGYRSSDIYLSRFKDGGWTTAQNAGRMVNTTLDEQIVGLRSDGLQLYMYIDHITKFGDIYSSTRGHRNEDFQRAKTFDKVVNAQIECAATLSDDGLTMVFARKERIEDKNDLYIIRRLPNGKWGTARRLPDVINSAEDEDFPFLSYDGQWLYFASEGHNSMGGYDIFRSRIDLETNTFGAPENLGYPINTADNDRSICITLDNRLAYVAAFRPEGFGDLDLYRVKLTDADPVYVIYSGRILLSDSAQTKNKPYDVQVNVHNTKTGEHYQFTASAKTGRLIMALPAGSYRLVAESEGYQPYKEILLVEDLGRLNLERRKNINLKRKAR